MKRVLKKSRNKVLAGVCGGIAEYYGWLPRPVRGVFIILGLAGGSGLVVYLVLAAVMPPPDSGSFDLDDYRKQ